MNNIKIIPIIHQDLFKILNFKNSEINGQFCFMMKINGQKIYIK